VTRIVLTAAARADAFAIFDRLEKLAGRTTVAKYLASFERLYQRLAEQPASGAPRPRLGANIRTVVVLPYVVVYRYVDGAPDIVVMRIVHGRRKISGSLLK
jgi:toxin ParE1/3/4